MTRQKTAGVLGTHFVRANSKNSAKFLVLAVGSCQFKKLGTMFVPFYMQA